MPVSDSVIKGLLRVGVTVTVRVRCARRTALYHRCRSSMSLLPAQGAVRVHSLVERCSKPLCALVPGTQ
jgi:hypothetical protein